MTHRLCLLAAAAAVSLLGAALPARAQVLQIDDGTAETAVGVTNNFPTAAYLNSFQTPAPGTTVVSAVQIAFGAPGTTSPNPNGLPIMVYLWSDPNGDGNPSDAQVLGSVAGVISSANTNTFVSFALPFSPQLITTQNFFVGFSFANIATPEPAPAGLDQTAPLANRSFAGFYPGTFDPNNLGGNGGILAPIENYVPGNFLIRADLAAVPEPATVLGGALAVGALGWHFLRRRRVPAGA